MSEDVLQQTIKAAIAGFAATKAEYALPDNDIDAGEMYTYAVAFEKITTELMERETKLVAVCRELRESIDTICTPRRWSRAMDNAWHENLLDINKAFAALKEACIKDALQHVEQIVKGVKE